MNEEDKSKKSLVASGLADENLVKSSDGKNSRASPKTQDTSVNQRVRERHKSRQRKTDKPSPKLNNKKFESNNEFLTELEEVYHIIKVDQTKESEHIEESKVQFYCELCQRLLKTQRDAAKHATSKQHQKQLKKKGPALVLSHISLIEEARIQSVSELLLSVVKQHGLDTATDIPIRYEIARQLDSYLHQKLPECSVLLYGSSCSGFGLKDSDVNLDLHVEHEADIPKSLLTAYEEIQVNSEYKEILEHFDAKFPRITFIHKKSGLSCELSAGYGVAPATSRLLKAYGDIDPLVRQLGIAFRYWGKVCGVDHQEDGSLPAHAFAIMVVHFLQHIEPPVLPRIDPEKAEIPLKDGRPIDYVRLNHTKKYSLGHLWIELFRYYCITFQMEECVVSIKDKQPVTREDKKWGMRRIAIEDPYSVKRNIANSMTSDNVFTYFMECLKATLKHFCDVPEQILKKDSTKTGSGKIDSGKHVLANDRLDYEKKEAEIGDLIEENKNVNLEKSGRVFENSIVDHSKNETSFTKNSDVSEDQETRVRNRVSKAVNINKESGHKKDCSNINIANEDNNEDDDNDVSGENDDDDCDIIFQMEDSEGDQLAKSQGLPIRVTMDKKKNTVLLEQETLTSEIGIINLNVKQDAEGNRSTNNLSIKDTEKACLHNEVDSKFASIHKPLQVIPSKDDKSFDFKFEEKILRGGLEHEVTCSHCKSDGHVKERCPDKLRKTPPLRKLPPMTQQYAALLERVCRFCKADFAFGNSELQGREQIVHILEQYIREVYPDARLHLFGSSKNGLGFRNSDLDICMTLEGKSKDDVECIPIINTLAKKFKKYKDFRDVIAITTAKVPIVKFYLPRWKVEADISLYNTLALENTKLLALYCKFDERVELLGYTVKVFVKICDIGDASKGSLSSYAYILMLLHFLQQKRVVPVFQELYSGETPPQKIIEGWNCWFYSDLKNLSKVWTEKDQNKKRAGELWVDFLNYYIQEFDFEREVVCCRRLKRLSKFEKLWTRSVFAIEDPFNLDHNLGGGISRRMGSYILNVFRRARERFGMPYPQLMVHHPNIVQQYFFDARILCDGDLAPAERNCKVCGRIGHYAKDCPFSKANRKAERKREQDEKRSERTHEKSEISKQSPGSSPITNQQVLQQVPKQVQHQVPKQSPQLPREMLQQVTKEVPPQVPLKVPQQETQPEPQQLSEQLPQQVPPTMSQQAPQQVPSTMSQQAPQQVPPTMSLQLPQQVPPTVSQQAPQQVPPIVSQRAPQQVPPTMSQQSTQQVPPIVSQQAPQPVPTTMSQQAPKQVPPTMSLQLPQQVPPTMSQQSTQEVPPTTAQQALQQVPPTMSQQSTQDVPPTMSQQAPQQVPLTIAQQAPQQVPPTLSQQSAQEVPPTVAQQSPQEVPPTMSQQMPQEVPMQVPQQSTQEIQPTSQQSTREVPPTVSHQTSQQVPPTMSQQSTREVPLTMSHQTSQQVPMQVPQQAPQQTTKQMSPHVPQQLSPQVLLLPEQVPSPQSPLPQLPMPLKAATPQPTLSPPLRFHQVGQSGDVPRSYGVFANQQPFNVMPNNPPPPQRQLHFVHPAQLLALSPPRHGGWPVPLPQSPFARAKADFDFDDKQVNVNCPKLQMPQSLDIANQASNIGHPMLPYPRFDQQLGSTVMSPGTPQTPALYYCLSPPGFSLPTRTRSVSESAAMDKGNDIQFQSEPRVMAGSAPMSFFPHSPPSVFRNNPWPQFHLPGVTKNESPQQEGRLSPATNSPLYHSVVSSPPHVSVGTPPSPWQQPRTPQAVTSPQPQTVMGSRMTADQFFELVRAAEREELQKKKEKKFNMEGNENTTTPHEMECTLNEPWNEDQLEKMVHSDKVRALWGSKKSGEEIEVGEEPGDEIGDNQSLEHQNESFAVSDRVTSGESCIPKGQKIEEQGTEEDHHAEKPQQWREQDDVFEKPQLGKVQDEMFEKNQKGRGQDEQFEKEKQKGEQAEQFDKDKQKGGQDEQFKKNQLGRKQDEKFEKDQQKRGQDEQIEKDKQKREQAEQFKKDQLGRGQDEQLKKGKQKRGQDEEFEKDQQRRGQDEQFKKDKQRRGQNEKFKKNHQGRGQAEQFEKDKQKKGQSEQFGKDKQKRGQDEQFKEDKQKRGQNEQFKKDEQGRRHDEQFEKQQGRGQYNVFPEASKKPQRQDCTTVNESFIPDDNKETQIVESHDGFSGNELNSTQDEHEKKKKRTRRGGRYRGKKETWIDFEAEGGKMIHSSASKSNKTYASLRDQKHCNKETLVVHDDSKAHSSQQNAKLRESAGKFQVANENNRQQKKEQQTEHKRERQRTNPKSKPLRHHSNSWSEPQSKSRELRAEDRRKTDGKVEKTKESISSGFKNKQINSPEQSKAHHDTCQPTTKSDEYERSSHTREKKDQPSENKKTQSPNNTSPRGNSSRGRDNWYHRGGRRRRDNRDDKEFRDRSFSAPQSPRKAGSLNSQQSSKEQ